MTLEFWTVSGAPSPWRVALAMAFKDVGYTTYMLSAAQKEHKSPTYLAINPRGTVPTLIGDGQTIGHSIASMAWLDRKFPEKPLFGETDAEAAQIWQRTMELFDYLPPATSRVLTPLFFEGVETANEELNAAALGLKEELAKLSDMLSDDPFLSGQRPGAADATAFPHVRLIQRAVDTKGTIMSQIGFPDLAALGQGIADWLAKVEQLPGVAKTFPPHWEPAS